MVESHPFPPLHLAMRSIISNLKRYRGLLAGKFKISVLQIQGADQSALRVSNHGATYAAVLKDLGHGFQ
jgi:hypothetical protein